MSGDGKIRVGSRKSELALIQTRHVISLLKGLHPHKDFEIVTMSTLGDKVLDIALPKIGEKSLFTKELEVALMAGHVDFVVHSLKDLPTTLPETMAIGAVLKREDPRDALVVQKDLGCTSLDALPNGSTIGTSSLRRTAQLARRYPHLNVKNIRGNLNTRLRKLDELQEFQAIILAAAGLVRMEWDSRITEVLEADSFLYAVGQGALAVECRESDVETIKLLQPLYDIETALRIIAERSFLKTLGGGCSAPVAVATDLTKTDDKQYTLEVTGAVWSLDGKEELREQAKTTFELTEISRCNGCPYAKQDDKICPRNCVGDIENLSPVAKKPKRDEIPIEVYKNDPHEHCPVEVPIGVDFMAKCPYLDGNVEGDSQLEITKCPFLQKNGKFGQLSDILTAGAGNSKNGGSVLYCGLVGHPDVPMDKFEEASRLGEALAQNLMKQGATEVMAKAQAHIRGTS